MADLGEMDADLVRATGFQPAAQKRVPRQALDDFDVRDRLFSHAGNFCAAAAAVAAIAHQARANGLALNLSRHNREILTVHRMACELLAQTALRLDRARE